MNNEHDDDDDDDDDDDEKEEVNAVENVTTQDVRSKTKNCFVLLLIPNMIVCFLLSFTLYVCE